MNRSTNLSIRLLLKNFNRRYTRPPSRLSVTKHSQQIRRRSTSFHLRPSTISTMDFLFCDYDFIGFDLDNTLCEYNLNEMVRMEYDVLSNYLVDKGWPEDKLKSTLNSSNLDFFQRGLILDFNKGNVLKLDRNGGIMKATHGTKILERDEIDDIYGPRNGNCPLLNKIKNDLTSAWNPECLSKYRLLLDYFDIPASLAFARCVDVMEEKDEREFDKCGLDTIACLKQMYNRVNFATGDSQFFKRLKEDPSKYINRCDPRLVNWLTNLKKKKSLFLVTGSNYDLADFVARHSLGPEWKNIFDLVVCFARKPFFFTTLNDFKQIVDNREGDVVDRIVVGGFYTEGNWKEVEKLFRTSSGRPEARGLYFGDNLVQDVFAPTKFQCCDTVAIVEELNENHPSINIVNSQFWGPMHAEGSWWGNVIKMYPKAFLPSINLLVR